MPPDRRSSFTAVMIGLVLSLTPSAARAMCNAVPTMERTFASTRGAVDRPYASPGREVTVTLGGCESPDAVFALPTALEGNVVEVTFEPPKGPAVTVVVPAEDIVSVIGRELTFRFPDTRVLLGELRTGPARLVVRAGAVELARIDHLGSRDGACLLSTHAVFSRFTALPPPNRFHCIARPGDCPGAAGVQEVLATVDAAGNLLVPWDWSNVYPSGRGFDPVARLVVAGQSGLEAFSDHRSGTGIVIPDASYVSAYNATGSVLPPFLDVGPPTGSGPFPGSTLVGTVDSRDGLLRIARRVGDGPEIFDLDARLEHGIGPVRIPMPTAVEDALIDLRSVRGAGRITALEEVGRGPRSAGLLIYDNRSGSLARIHEAPGGGKLPRRVAVSDELVALYDVERDATDPDLTLLPLERLPAPGGGHARPVPASDLLATGLFGSRGDDAPPSIGKGMVGGYAGSERLPVVFDLRGGDVAEGTPIGGADLVRRATGIASLKESPRFVEFGGEIVPFAPGEPGRVLAVGNRAVFAVCETPCGEGSDVVLTLLDEDGEARELARNVGVPFVFTGTLVGLAIAEDGRHGGPATRVDLDGNGTFDGVFLALYLVDDDRFVIPAGPTGGPLGLPSALDLAAGEDVILLGLDEASAGPLDCDGDRGERVLTFVSGSAARLVNTREPMAPGTLAAGRNLLSFVQPQDVFGKRLGAGFLTVMRDGDDDEWLDPYDNCPLQANVAQGDADGDGTGDACDADCAGVDCPSPSARATAAEQRCRRHVRRAVRARVHAELQQWLHCRVEGASCERAARARARRVERDLLAGCDDAARAAVAVCGGAGDDACLSGAVAAAVRSAGTATRATVAGEEDGLCQRQLVAGMAHYVRQRYGLLARCRERLAAGKRLWRAGAVPLVEPSACHLEVKTARRLAALGRSTRASIARACTPDTIRALGPCGGVDALDALIGPDGTTGCLAATGAHAVDLVVTAELGAAAAVPVVAAPCPSRPAPTATPTPRPRSISVRARLAAPDGRRADLDLGWKGLLHNQRVFAGAGFDADLDCDGGGPCRIHAALAGTAFAAPAPISSEGTAMCLITRFTGDVTGSFDPATGAMTAILPLRAEAVATTALGEPCPACIASDGEPDIGDPGICSGGLRSGSRCRVGALADPGFGVAAATSADCPPEPEPVPRSLTFTVEATTGTSLIAIGPESPPCAARRGHRCPCSICDDAAGTPCRSDADCPARDDVAGTCGAFVCRGGANDGVYCAGASECPGGQCISRANLRFGDLSEPNGCTEPEPPDPGPACREEGQDDAGCPASPTSSCSDEPWRSCNDPLQCIVGTCLTRTRRCFPDPLVRSGTVDPPVDGKAQPTLVSTFCVGSGAHANFAAGLPGPAALVLPVDVQFEP